ncbi:beta-1,4-N-acetylgalactosaminyltransferase bre-4 [Anthonomus grandis grandis]|uniref:beta-1,4-N-acetylgalactosaminyltransferase bre-4 n=1 Tax=Anthonomus grandis grandis TaxID=2921223 RepID=UPI0021651DB3|nr:beta-1,4-N-acetylgalactosaminyltransferase bre-4 [Anthonomus grandis grandis]XP_050311251.1 beta-1,4-N-acetylgalactosaminyltransferase bre-4 [Anthonomus grandis grandis]
MPSWMLQGAPYKGLFILVLVFVALEYIFNTVTETRNAIFNATRSYQLIEEKLTYGPAAPNHTKKANLSMDLSNLHYIVTVPPALIGVNLSTTYVTTVKRESDFTAENGTSTDKPPCADITQTLYGRVPIRKYPIPSLESLEKKFDWLMPGGHWSPPKCTVDKRVALVVPFRDRGGHLLLFLQHMHPFLRKQQLDYTIFVVEQEGNGPFNRAMLMNVGYSEALKSGKFDCFIFHDVDLLPEDDRNLYSCPEQPRHMSVAVDMFQYKLPYPAIFGGVSAISTAHFKLLNGFSNCFWGWGGEDDDMSNRIRYHRLYISRYPITIARYTMLSHRKDPPNPSRYDVLKKGQKLFDKDGLNDLEYVLVMKKEKLLYTWILARLMNHTSDHHHR